jgi:hypothetical protein
MNFNKLAEQLDTNGVVVISIAWFVDNLLTLQQQFLDTLRNFPEYKRSPENPDFAPDNTEIDYVLGGFSALGNPSSFHNPFVRNLREWCLRSLLPFFREYKKLKKQDWKLEQTYDRMLFRLAGQTPSKESWHRDEAKTKHKDDLTFGGWINLDDKPQYFSCIQGTHGISPETAGFATIPKDIVEQEDYNNRKSKIEIPPGNIVIFFENTIHEVVSTKLNYNSKRLFLGWRLTHLSTPLFDNLEESQTSQRPMKIKSDQTPALYSSNHISALLRHKIVDKWARKTFKPELTYQHTITSGKQSGEVRTRVSRYMKSLTEYNLPLYKSYNKHEVQIYKPNTNWKLLLIGKTNIRSEVSL